MHERDERANLTRSDFLRATALGTGGLSLAALAGCEPRAEVAEVAPRGVAPKQGYVVTVTHGPEDPTRVMLALVTASRLPEGDNHVWFAIDGGQVAKKEQAEQVTSPLFPAQGDAARVLEQIRSRGTAVHI